MKRIEEFESRIDALIEEFSDIPLEDVAESLEFYADVFKAKTERT